MCEGRNGRVRHRGLPRRARAAPSSPGCPVGPALPLRAPAAPSGPRFHARALPRYHRRVTIDILCKVVDNYGDIGVAWRLARALSELPDPPALRLVVDDL